jgi:hypothetical protein
MPQKTIDLFISTVDPKKSTVVLFPDFIAVFGGALSKKKSRAKKAKSQRDAFVKWITANEVALFPLLLLPESYDDWSDFNVYSDLLLFEQDLGYLTSAVLVFLEGPGAIAELGAFSQIDSLRERLLVVISDSHASKNSFITLGPIRSITETNKHSDGLCVVPDSKAHEFDVHIPLVMGPLSTKRKHTNQKKAFSINDAQHQILLVLDLINLFLALQITEIQTLFAHFGNEIPLRRLEQILFVLQKTELIKRQQIGNNTYYIPLKLKGKYIDYTSSKKGKPFNRSTTQAAAHSEFKNDQPRRTAYELVTKQVGRA